MAGPIGFLITLLLVAVFLAVVWFILGLIPVIPANIRTAVFLIVVLLVLLYTFGGYLGTLSFPYRR